MDGPECPWECSVFVSVFVSVARQWGWGWGRDRLCSVAIGESDLEQYYGVAYGIAGREPSYCHLVN